MDIVADVLAVVAVDIHFRCCIRQYHQHLKYYWRYFFELIFNYLLDFYDLIVDFEVATQIMTTSIKLPLIFFTFHSKQKKFSERVK